METLKIYPTIGAHNYRNVDGLIAEQEEAVRKAAGEHDKMQKELAESSETLATAEKVFGGTYIQSLVAAERERRETKYIPNGSKFASNGSI